MPFANNKKTFLAKLDKSKKGEVDQKIVPLLELINSKNDYYTTSSCSGRVYFWQGGEKKNQIEWLKISHELIDDDFFTFSKLKNESKLLSGIIWLRLEPIILHVCCQNLEAANKLLLEARKLYKKSCLLTASNKIIVEIRGSEQLEMPFYLDGKLLYAGELEWLKNFINQKMERMWLGMKKFADLLAK